jgi:hypothetical protein
MKIKICIANYGTSQIHHMNRMIEEFKKYKKYKTDITIYTTVPVEHKHILYSDGIGNYLPFQCRHHMAESVNDFDLFLYNENDHLITEDNIDAFLEHSSRLENNHVSGFIRYEERDGKKILLDPNPGREFIDGIPTLVKNRYINDFSLYNNHQGCWLLDKDKINKVIDSGEFLINSPKQYLYSSETGMDYCPLEQGASDPYTICGLEKVFPKEIGLLKRLLIFHMPIKYSIGDLWISHGIEIEDLQNF